MTLVILDCPGVASTATNLAMKAADLCLLPARPTLMDIRASKATVQTLMGMSRPFAFVLNQCPPSRASSRTTDAAQGVHMMGSLAGTMLGIRADYQDAMAAGMGVTEYAPEGKAADENPPALELDRKTPQRQGNNPWQRNDSPSSTSSKGSCLSRKRQPLRPHPRPPSRRAPPPR